MRVTGTGALFPSVSDTALYNHGLIPSFASQKGILRLSLNLRRLRGAQTGRPSGSRQRGFLTVELAPSAADFAFGERRATSPAVAGEESFYISSAPGQGLYCGLPTGGTATTVLS